MCNQMLYSIIPSDNFQYCTGTICSRQQTFSAPILQLCLLVLLYELATCFIKPITNNIKPYVILYTENLHLTILNLQHLNSEEL